MDFIDLTSVGSTLTKDLKVFPIDITEAPTTASEADEMMGVHIYDLDNEWFASMSAEDLKEFFEFVESTQDLTVPLVNGERGLSAGLLAGAQSFMKSDILDSVKQKMNLKPDVGAMPMGGKMAPDKLGDLSSAYSGSPTGYAEWSSPKDALGVAEKFAYSPTGFGAGEKALGGKSLLGTGDFANQLQSTGEHFASGKFMEGWSPTIIEAWQNRINEGIEPAKDLASEPSYGNPYLLGAIGSQEGGMVRDDMALLDMIYRR